MLLLTPTRDRPRSFKLCERWMARQTRRDFEWVVVDDGDEPITPTMGQIYLRMPPSGDACTIHRNLLVALELAEAMAPGAVLFIEDDDWYSPRYVEDMARELETCRLVGEMRRRFYHLPSRGFLTCYNRKHAALAATGMIGCMIGTAKRAVHRAESAGRPYVDLYLWSVGDEMAPRHQRVEENDRGVGTRMLCNRCLSIGIKGAPGRGGLGDGHGPEKYQYFDPSGRLLRSWVGPADAADILALVPRRVDNAPAMEKTGG